MTSEEKNEKLNFLNHLSEKQHLIKVLNIEFIDISEHHLSAKMPINTTVHQPFGLLHGGASCCLAETLGSCLSLMSIDQSNLVPLGIELNSHHIKSKKDGFVVGTASFINKGKSIHLCEIQIKDENKKLVNYSTMTNKIIAK